MNRNVAVAWIPSVDMVKEGRSHSSSRGLSSSSPPEELGHVESHCTSRSPNTLEGPFLGKKYLHIFPDLGDPLLCRIQKSLEALAIPVEVPA
jgi:hypothetical protein